MTPRMMLAAGALAFGTAFAAAAQDTAPPPGGRSGMGAMIGERFAEMDADHDGVVTRAEFDAYRARMRAARGGGNAPPRAAPAGGTDLFDRHDGKVTREEAQAAAAMLRAR